MPAPPTTAMNQDIAIYAGVGATIGLLVGYAWGNISSKRNQNKKVNQKLLQNEIDRWRIKPKYATLLMGKDPKKDAEDEYEEYKQLVSKNEVVIEEIEASVNQHLKEVTKLRSEYEKLESPIEKSFFMEQRYAIWTARVVRERLRTQNASNQLIAHAYNMEFLNFCRQGNVKPEIVGLMDQLDLAREIKNSHKKNWDGIVSITDSIFTDYQEEQGHAAYLFGAKK